MKKTLFLLVLLSGALAGCVGLPDRAGIVESKAFRDTSDTRLGKVVAQAYSGDQNSAGKSFFHVLSDGMDAFAARVALSSYADRSIDFQYYIYRKDLTGRLITYKMLEAADRGVRVRMLLDDFDINDIDEDMLALNRHPNIEVRLFNPFNRITSRLSQIFTSSNPVTRRMHNKSFTVDNQVTILGGRNIADEYFNADPAFVFADVDVVGVGDVAGDVSDSFDLYWNSSLSYPISMLVGKILDEDEIKQHRENLREFVAEHSYSGYLKALANSEFVNQMVRDDIPWSWGKAHVIFDTPDKILTGIHDSEYHLIPQLQPYITGLKSELIIFSPYFIPGKKGTEFLVDLVKKGIKVRILTNSLTSTDVGIVYAAYTKYRKKLLRGGVEIYELNRHFSREERKELRGEEGGSSKASLHAKTFVLDRKLVFIGSLNLDARSMVQNTEIGVVIASPEIAEKMAKAFDDNICRVSFRVELDGNEIVWKELGCGHDIVHSKTPYAGYWRRFSVWFMRFLPGETLL